MDLETVRWFLAVAEHGHVTRTAAELRISQPGLSRAIARLERELGVRLFDREGRTLRLSPYGEIFRGHAERLVAEEKAARHALTQAADPGSGEVGLAFLHTQGTALVPELLRDYRREHPRVTFRLSQGSSEHIEAAVIEGRADLAITSPRPAELAWHPLATERLRLAVPAGHRLAGRDRLRLSEAAGEPFILMRRGYGLRSITDELFRSEGIRPDIAFEGEEAATLRGLVAAGLGVAIVPPGDPTPGVCEVVITGARRTIGLAWVAGRTRPPVAEGFRRFVLARAPA
ncbi:LysR family transcriptional regulator [Actinoallomurus purpureus]|uniref:LysR family transcriptional regulator n=1 Tax=Actinoallomurus purpureus TaxID=478114 RepID=UPI0020931050|nr:LysR family transcriptional regulator [Actinoallomurus purpureus]MCO6006031.1 LysR family transcriptional regulator [Actinoallomurus purpureus]